MQSTEPITEEWLKSVGFKWHQFYRQPGKHWLLWMGSVKPRGFNGTEDLGIEVAFSRDNEWFCWLRSDTAHRYSRFIHIRHITSQSDVISLVEACTGVPWCPENHLYGSVHCQEHADSIRRDDERLDRRMLREGHPWKDSEKDPTQGRPLAEHLDVAEKVRENLQ